MGVTVGEPLWLTGGVTTSASWTVITPSGTAQNGYNTGPPASGTTMIVYVANGGSDSPSSTEGSLANPYATPEKGMSRLRNGEPDWCLLKKGNTFTLTNWLSPHYGKSATEPEVLASYDPAFLDGSGNAIPNPYGSALARPLVNCNPTTSGLMITTGATFTSGGDYLAVMGLEAYSPQRDPTNGAYVPGSFDVTCMSLLNPWHWLLVEDVKCSYFGDGLDFTPSISNPTGGPKGVSVTLKVRRCVVARGYSNAGGNVSGVNFGNCSDPLIEECVLDHNGWNEVIPKGPSVFFHNLYCHPNAPNVQTLLTLQGCILSRDSSGPQYRMGGTLYNNLYLDNQYTNYGMMYSGLQTVVDSNVYLEGTDVFGLDTVSPVSNGDLLNVGTALLTNNIVANSIGGQDHGFQFVAGMNGVTLSNNILFNWGAGGTDVNQTTGALYSWSIAAAGSGYTNLSKAITSLSADSNNQIVCTAANTTGMKEEGIVKIVGTGTAADGIWKVGTGSLTGTTFTLQWSTYNAGTMGSATGTVYYPYYHQTLTTFSGPGPTSNHATAQIIVQGGVVVAVDIGTTEPDGVVDSWGQDYTTSSVLTASFGGGSGFRLNVTTICVNTVGANKFDKAGTNTYGFPGWAAYGSTPTNVTAGNYYNSIGNPYGFASTTDGFCEACLLQSKGSWNDNLTAYAANIQIRAGFGITIGTSLDLDPSSYTITGAVATDQVPVSLNLATGSYSITGDPVSFPFYLSPGSISINGANATLFASASDVVLDLDLGSYSIVGSNVSSPFTLDPGSYSTVGFLATAQINTGTFSLNLDLGAYVTTGFDASTPPIPSPPVPPKGRIVGLEWQRADRYLDYR